MDDIIGMIKIFGGNFAPKSFAFCDGRLLAISSNTALFSLLGTTYGGDGKTTFALPDLRSRIPIGFGQGSGLSQYSLGETGGSSNVTLTNNEMPMHNHTFSVSSAAADTIIPVALVSIAAPTAGSGRSVTPTNGFNVVNPDIMFSRPLLSFMGGNQAHNNMQPYMGMNYIICLQGYYPSRN